MVATTKVALLATTLEAAMAAALVPLDLLVALAVENVVALVASVDMVATPEASVAVVASEADLLVAELSAVAVPVVSEALVALVADAASVLVLQAFRAELTLREPSADKDSVALAATNPDTESPVAREDGEEYLS